MILTSSITPSSVAKANKVIEADGFQAITLWINYAHFWVTGSAGDEYFVEMTPRGRGIPHAITCNCAAGKNDRSCWHVALVREFCFTPEHVIAAAKASQAFLDRQSRMARYEMRELIALVS